MQYKLTIKVSIHCHAFSIIATFTGVILYIFDHFGALLVSSKCFGCAIQSQACKSIQWTAYDSSRLSCCRCVVSGAGKVALFAVEKLITFGAIPVTISGKFVWFLW